MFEILDIVALTEPDFGLEAGHHGMVMFKHDQGYDVEFIDEEMNTVAIITLAYEKLILVAPYYG